MKLDLMITEFCLCFAENLKDWKVSNQIQMSGVGHMEYSKQTRSCESLEARKKVNHLGN